MMNREIKMMEIIHMFPEEKNIQTKMKMYNETVPDEERVLINVPVVSVNDNPPEETTPTIEETPHPLCPECGTIMWLRVLVSNPYDIKMQFVCLNKDCDIILNSKYGPVEWLDMLVKEEIDLEEYLKSLIRTSKKEDIPGTVDAILEEPCPACGRLMRLYKPCCGSPEGYKGCSCGYKINM